MSKVIVKEVGTGVLSLTLNRPEKRNALNIELLESLILELEKAQESHRVVILKGAGPVFSAGLDLKEALDHEKADRSAELVSTLLQTVWRSRAVTICSCHGAAIAGGAGLMAACDFVVLEEGAKIGFPEIHRGLVAALVMTIIKRQVPLRKMRQLLLLGELIDAREAHAFGLVDFLVEPGERDVEVMQLTGKLLKSPRHAINVTKDLMHALDATSIPRDLQIALEQHREMRNSKEALEGIESFLEGREPSWRK